MEAQQWDSVVQVSSKLVKLPVLGDPRPLVKPLWFEIMVQISTKEQLPSENTEQWKDNDDDGLFLKPFKNNQNN